MMWQKFREFMTMLAPPYDGPSYFDRHAAIEMERMRLRDEFAMAALTGLLQQGYDKFEPNEWSHQAYSYADAMLAVREAE